VSKIDFAGFVEPGHAELPSWLRAITNLINQNDRPSWPGGVARSAGVVGQALTGPALVWTSPCRTNCGPSIGTWPTSPSAASPQPPLLARRGDRSGWSSMLSPWVLRGGGSRAVQF